MTDPNSVPDSTRSIDGDPIFIPPQSPEGPNPFSCWKIGGNSEHGSVNGDTFSDNMSTGSSPRPLDLIHQIQPGVSANPEYSPVQSPASPMPLPFSRSPFLQPRASPGSSPSGSNIYSPAQGNGSPFQNPRTSPCHSRAPFPTPPIKYHPTHAQWVLPRRVASDNLTLVTEPVMRRKVIKRQKPADQDYDDVISSGSDSESITSDRSVSPGGQKCSMKLVIPDRPYRSLSQSAKEKAKQNLRQFLKTFTHDQTLAILQDMLTHDEVKQLQGSILPSNMESERVRNCTSALHDPNCSFIRHVTNKRMINVTKNSQVVPNQTFKIVATRQVLEESKMQPRIKILYPLGSLNANKDTSDDILVLSDKSSSSCQRHGAKTEIMQLLCLMSNFKDWTDALNAFYIGDPPPKGSLCFCSRGEPAFVTMMRIGILEKPIFVGMKCLEIIARKKDHPMGVWAKFLLQFSVKGIKCAKLIDVNGEFATFKIANMHNVAEHLEQLASVYQTIPISTTKQALKICTKKTPETIVTKDFILQKDYTIHLKCNVTKGTLPCICFELTKAIPNNP